MIQFNAMSSEKPKIIGIAKRDIKKGEILFVSLTFNNYFQCEAIEFNEDGKNFIIEKMIESVVDDKEIVMGIE